MIPTLEVGQRVLVQRVSYHFSDPEIGDIVVFHPPKGADTTETCGLRAAAAQGGLPGAGRRGGRHELHQARRRHPGRHAQHRGRTRDRQRRADPRRLHQALRQRPRMRPAEGDHDPARPLLHDGRQPWSQRRQPILGTSPQGLDHRQGLCHLLAPRPDRPPLSRGSGTAAGPTVAGPRGCSVSTSSSGTGSSPAPTRRAGDRSPVRSSPRRCCSTIAASARTTQGAGRARRLEAQDRGGARAPLSGRDRGGERRSR